MDTKELILNYLEEKGVIDPFSSEFYKNTTSNISNELHTSRTLTSQYLNELYKERKLLKIISRPVIYISAKAISSKFNINITEFSFDDLDMYKKWYKNIKSEIDIIGFNGSLLYTVKQIQSGLLYPNNGLPILLCGQEGSGKKYIVKELLSYNKERNNLDQNWKIKFICVSNFRNLSSIIDEVNNILETNCYLLLYLYDFSAFNSDIIIKLIEELLKLKDTKNNFNFVLDINENEWDGEFVFLEKIVPIISKVPALSQRPVYERKAILIYLLKNESEKINKNIKISSKAFEILELLTTEMNISIIKKMISQMLANAYRDNLNENTICIRIHHFPVEISNERINSVLKNNRSDIELEISNMDYKKIDFPLIDLCNNILEFIEVDSNNKMNFEYIVDNIFYKVREYLDEQMKSYYYEQMKNTIDLQIIKNIIVEFENSLNIYMPVGFNYFIKEFFDFYSIHNQKKEIDKIDSKKSIKNFSKELNIKFSSSYLCSRNCISKISKKLNIKVSEILIILMTICIEKFNKNRNKNQMGALIVSHGTSTATSICDTANFLLGRKIFTGLDMPLNMSVYDIAKKVNEYMEIHNIFTYMIILVDMGSLNDLPKYIENIHNVTYGIINNISTSVALEVGNQIINNENFFNIMENTVNSIKFECKIIQSEVRKKAIVVTSDLGRPMTSKISKLFKASLPKEHPFTIIEIDYNQLENKRENNSIFKEFDVVLLVRPDGLNLDGVESVSLEDVIYMNENERFDLTLNKYLTREQIQLFHMNFLKNFSLENVLENLTILNAKNLMDLVVESVESLIEKLNRTLNPKVKIGIYMHICFLIERLVTKNEIQNNEEESNIFLQNHFEFVKAVQKSFQNILENYSVDLPISEVIYLYRYMYEEEEI